MKLIGTATGLLVAIMCSLCSQAIAQSKEYSLTHKLNANLGVGQVYKGTWSYSCYAYARDKTGKAEDSTGFQTVAFAPPSNDLKNALALLTDAWAYSEASYAAQANGAIEHHIEGIASVTRPNGYTAYSRSYSRIGWKVGTKNAKNVIRWEAKWHFDTLAGGAFRDPLTVNVLNLDTQEQSDQLLWDVDFDVPGQAASAYEGGLFSFSADSGSLHWFIGGSSPSQLDLTVANSLVATVAATGLFADLAPKVGDSSSFSFQVGTGAFDIDYNLGEENVNGYETEYQFDTLGQVAVPEPGSMAMLAAATALCIKLKRRRK